MTTQRVESRVATKSADRLAILSDHRERLLARQLKRGQGDTATERGQVVYSDTVVAERARVLRCQRARHAYATQTYLNVV